MSPFVMSCLLVLLPGYFLWSAVQRLALATRGPAAVQFTMEEGDLGRRIESLLVYVFGQKKMANNPRYALAGVGHMMVFGAFVILLLNSIMLWVRGYDTDFDFWGILAVDHPIGAAYSIAKELVELTAIIGAGVFLYYRTVAKQKRMSHSTEAFVILGIIMTMMLADMLYVGAGIVLSHQASGEPLHYSIVEPAGSVFALILGGMNLSEGALKVFEHIGFWWHAALVLVFLNLLPHSKHFHVITVFPNVFARDLKPNALKPIEDLEGKVEREEPIGFVTAADLSWKDVLDLYTCTECGRCSDNCPAYTTDKKLSPKHVTLALRDHLYECAPHLMYKGTASEGEQAGDGPEVHTHELHHGDPPKGAYHVPDQLVDLVPNVIDPDVIWACTSCRACEEQCPVMISYVDKFVQMRRDAVMIKNEFPAELMNPFNGIETNGNPWNMSAMDRATWTEGLNVPLLMDNPNAEVLYWVGCAASYDDRAKKIARATVKLLQAANVDFAILGTEETCTGDPARRAGNEYLFQTVAEQNVETLNGYEASKKQIVTTCPHCFNTLANEYPDFGGKFDVVHHATFLEDLVKRGKLKPKQGVDGGDVVFHDSCYLGRYNEVYDAPREVLKSIPGLNLREPEYWTRNKGLCCGAGGAQMFMEEQNENRVNVKRTLQLLDTGAKTIASGCPFCMTMLTDGLKAQEKEDQIRQVDIAELLVESIEDKAVAEAAE